MADNSRALEAVKGIQALGFSSEQITAMLSALQDVSRMRPELEAEIASLRDRLIQNGLTPDMGQHHAARLAGIWESAGRELSHPIIDALSYITNGVSQVDARRLAAQLDQLLVDLAAGDAAPAGASEPDGPSSQSAEQRTGPIVEAEASAAV